MAPFFTAEFAEDAEKEKRTELRTLSKDVMSGIRFDISVFRMLFCRAFVWEYRRH